MRRLLLLLTLFELGCGASTHGVEIRLAHGSAGEASTARQLEGLISKYDLEPWRFTSVVIIDEESIPHSHPVLTLHTRHAKDDLLLLSTYVHEQSHWYLEQNREKTASAVADLKAMFPELPVGYPEGANDLESSYEHLLVIALERFGLIRTVGELAALEAMQFWTTDHYRALYRIVLADPRKIWEVLEHHGLAPR